ncbi:MAG: hypothetical protein WC658_03295 [Candidatus Omnitrophota bacterium]
MNKKAQITLEASLIFAIVTAGLLASKAYLDRAIQGNWKTNTDSFSEGQYRPEEDLILDEIDPDPTVEIVSEIEFVNPRINIKEYYKDGYFGGSMYELEAANEGASPLANIVRVPGWGRYE